MALHPRLQWLSGLKSTQLKCLGTRLGIKQATTKFKAIEAIAQLYECNDKAPDSSCHDPKNDFYNIVSIDMGVKNLAYCKLSARRPGQTSDRPWIPTVAEWARIDTTKTGPDAQATQLHLRTSKDDTAQQEDTFELDIYASRAYNLLSALILDHTPTGTVTHVLIERQRNRSMGSRAVLEWTLRVNTLEAMLYGVLETFQRQGIWNGTVLGLPPGRVANFWVSSGASSGKRELFEGKALSTEVSKKSSGSTSKITKMRKIGLVTAWLQETGQRRNFDFDPQHGQADRMRAAFLHETGRVRGQRRQPRKTASSPEILTKVDDLADCLLQGVTFLAWEKARADIWHRGLEAASELIGLSRLPSSELDWPRGGHQA